MSKETELVWSEYQKMNVLYKTLWGHVNSGLVSEEWLKRYIQDKFVIFSNPHKIHIGIKHVNSLLLGEIFNGYCSAQVEQKIYTMRRLISEHHDHFLTYYFRPTGEEMVTSFDNTFFDHITVVAKTPDEKSKYTFNLHETPPNEVVGPMESWMKKLRKDKLNSIL